MQTRVAVVALLSVALTVIAAAEPPRVKLGIDVLIDSDFAALKGKKVGLITNPTGLTRELRPTIDVLHKAPGVQLITLFGPEHGVRGEAVAGAKVDDARDAITGLPAYSLYGKTRKATPEMLTGLDAVVFDVQDVGARSYTYISSMALAMETCAENGVEFIILDRPNPIGGNRVEGRVLDPKFTSFVGQLPIPYCHGMTVGELAQMINGEGWLGELTPQRGDLDAATDRSAAPKKSLKCKLTVILMQGYTRDMIWSETGLRWVPTSPHIPRPESAFFYSITGIVGELEVLNVGVGYTLPFELVGHPQLDPLALAAELSGRNLPGLQFRPIYYQPFYSHHTKKTCGGVQILLTDAKAADLTATGLHITDAVRKLNPEIAFFESKRNSMYDKVCGTDQIRKMFEQRKPIAEIVAAWRATTDEFRKQRAKYLLY
ncbi:MAG: exo-beta-N-acetylmuramidase NamZ domain-containing protein [Phycisphaerae bacterium]